VPTNIVDTLDTIPPVEKKVWKLALPDWGELDTVWKNPMPFALWTVGEQALVFHWLDAAVDKDFDHIIFYVADRPSAVREALDNAQMWPVTWEIKAVAELDPNNYETVVNRLPSGEKPIDFMPEDGWSLIKYWRALENEWLEIFYKETEKYGQLVAIGKHCEISSRAQLIPPYWVGDFVSIGPGSSVGPNVVIEDGCVLEGGNKLNNAHLGHHTYLGPEIDLDNASMFRNQLLNLKYNARVDNLEPFLAGDVGSGVVTKNSNKPKWNERIIALLVLLSWRALGQKAQTYFVGIDGQNWPQIDGTEFKDRAVWLKLVVKGKMRLFGVTPRAESALESITDEWSHLLREAPVGAFSYADLTSSNEVGSFEEAMHCIYQITGDSERCERLLSTWFQQNISKAAGVFI